MMGWKRAMLGLAVLCAVALAPADETQDDRGGVTAAELAALQTAMELAILDNGVFHTIENLNDLPPGSDPVHDFDDIDNMGAGTPVLLESTGDFSPTRRFFTGAQWQGPYVTYQESRIELVPPFDYDEGTLVDLFGQPYRLYSPLGLVDPPTESIVLDALGDRFDRWAFVSFGPDNTPDTADDAIRMFGGAPTMPVMSSVIALPPPLGGGGGRGGPIYGTNDTVGRIPPGSLIQVRGYNFGATQGTSRLLLDGVDLGAAVVWGFTTIEMQLPPSLVGSEIQLELGGSIVDTFAVQVATAASDWIIFE